MMRIVRPRLAALSRVALFTGLFGASEALAQNAVFTGKVTNEQGTAVAGANIAVRDMGIRATSNSDGTYTLTVPDDRASG